MFLLLDMSSLKKTKFEMAVIDRVREMRLAKGYSQEMIAGFLNLTTSFIGQVESPNIPSKYNLNHLNRLAKELGCSPKDFIPDDFLEEDYWEEE